MAPISLYFCSPFLLDIKICEPMLKPNPIVKSVKYRIPPIADAPNSTSPTLPRKTVSIKFVKFCASKLRITGNVTSQMYLYDILGFKDFFCKSNISSHCFEKIYIFES